MDSVRVITATVLALRSGAGIKVRQPLATVFLLDKFLEGKEEVIKILLDEVNVKNVVFDKSMAGDGGVSIDTVLTEELRGEGIIRELSRVIQGLRADAAYRMSDEVSLYISSNDQFVDLVQRYTLQLKRAVGAKEIEFKKFDKIDVQAETKIADQAVWIGVRRA